MGIKPISSLDLFHSQCKETHMLHGAVTRIMARPMQSKDCKGKWAGTSPHSSTNVKNRPGGDHGLAHEPDERAGGLYAGAIAGSIPAAQRRLRLRVDSHTAARAR